MGRAPARQPASVNGASLVRLLLCLLFITCAREARAGSTPVSQSGSTVRDARVLVASDATRVRVRSKSPLTLLQTDGTRRSVPADGSWLVASPAPRDGIRIGNEVFAGRRLTILEEAGRAVALSTVDGGTWTSARDYPGALTLSIDDDGRFDVINAVEVEAYVGAVVAGEAWPTFHDESLRALAIAVRTFVLFQMSQRSEAPFDVAATQHSQVYRGLRKDAFGRRAADAARYTRGIVATYVDGDRPRLFCTFYSAACGGVSQSASIFGTENNIAPLAGGVRCDECRIAPGETYRWGPVRFSTKEVMSRLVARYPAYAELGELKRISVASRTNAGRPVMLRISGTSGSPRELLAERFRLAIDGGKIRSTDCKIAVTSGKVIFSEGRGFGHGLGLCQWGAEGHARKGLRAGRILRTYYPECRLARVY